MSTEASSNYIFKVVLLGEGKVGKSSILLRFVHDQFNKNHLSTVQASFMNKKINFDNKRVNLNIWDTAGQEIFHALGPIYYRNSHGAILVYDISSEDSFDKIKVWIKELKKIVGNDIVCVIVGNKTDLIKDQKLSYDPEPHLSYAKSVGAMHFLTSAKLNENIDEAFLEISKSMMKIHDEKQLANASLNRTGSMRRQLRVEESTEAEEMTEAPTTSRCCGR
ncbi:CLUMA_CG018920, isoform A [Clunio marinus]|uniref:Ras-related protein Rab-21 n=1 Tax=Clunio marinus TaxID=568069 RepID=A0A1J1J0L7_9DIPT|nr:CLUMA_CG018920, isoform A [Clunio marinus]